MNTQEIKDKVRELDLQIEKLRLERDWYIYSFAKRADSTNPFSEAAMLLVFQNFGKLDAIKYLALHVVDGKELGVLKARQVIGEILHRHA